MSYQVDYGVAIFVPPKVRDEAYRLTKILTGLRIPLVYELDAEVIPHITLFQGRFLTIAHAEEGWEALHEIVLPILRRKQVSVVMSRQIEVRPNNGNIFWNCFRDAALRELHERVAFHMQLYTHGLLMEQSVKAMANAENEDAKKRIERYGVVASASAYHPHVTLARLQSLLNTQVVNVAAIPQSSEFQVEKICFGPLNQYGQMYSEGLKILA